MEPSICTGPSAAVTVYIGIDWADQKHAIALRSAAEPSKVQHQVVEQKPEALMQWIGQLEQRFGRAGQNPDLSRAESGRADLSFDGL
jgi:hypothetical protein